MSTYRKQNDFFYSPKVLSGIWVIERKQLHVGKPAYKAITATTLRVTKR